MNSLYTKITSMKKLLILLLAISTLNTFSQKREKRDVGGFNQVVLAFPGTLYIKEGSNTSLELSGDNELLEKIETEVEGSRLTIRRKEMFKNWYNWGELGSLTAYLTLPKLNGVSVMGSGKIIGQDNFKTGAFYAKVSGSGSISIEAETEDADLNVSGSGNIKINGVFGRVDSSISGSGKIVLNGSMASTIESTISGSGRLEISGSAKTLRSNISGSGKVAGYALSVDKCFARISGSGSVEITAKEEIEAEISGSGTVIYKGNPDHVSSHSSGSGKVIKGE